MQRIGIMQGRLLPPEEGRFQCFPRQGWMTEFSLAAAAGLDSIEWIYDMWGEGANPISSDRGIDHARHLAKEHNVEVVSLCADYFMERPLIRASSEEKRRGAKSFDLVSFTLPSFRHFSNRAALCGQFKYSNRLGNG